MNLIFMFTILIISMLLELICSTWGFVILFTFPVAYYFLLNYSFKMKFILILFLGMLFDILYAHSFPFNLVGYALFTFCAINIQSFKYSRKSLFFMTPSIWGITFILLPQQLYVLLRAPYSSTLLFNTICVYLFAILINFILTPILFAVLDYFCDILGFESLTKSRRIDFESMGLS